MPLTRTFKVVFAVGVVAVVGVSAAVIARADTAAGGAGIAADRQAKLLARFPEADADGDGTLTRAELREFAKSHPPVRRGLARPWQRLGAFRRAVQSKAAAIVAEHPETDADADGKLERSEAREFFKTHPGAFGQRLLERRPELDTNADGLLSFDEMRSAMLARFPKLDANGDGQLSDAEVDAARQARQQQRRAWLLERVPEADTDADGHLSDDEVRAALQAHRSANGPE